jgi:hypothetical protein
MSSSLSVKLYISDTPFDKIITTREVLHLGTRTAVDQTLYRLVKCAELIRLARGVFVRAGSAIPPALAIVQAKSAAFGRSITTHGLTLAQDFGLVSRKDSLPIYCISSGTSAFHSIYDQTTLAGTCDRKRHLGESIEGRTIRAFWQLGKEVFESFAEDLIGGLTPSERVKIARQAAWMPAWMSDRFFLEK